MTDPAWRKSSFSGSNGDCFELAELDEMVLVRNSNRPAAGALTLDRSAVATWIEGCRRGEFDDLR